MIKIKLKSKNNPLTVQLFYDLQNHPTFHSKERLVNLVRLRECFVGLPILLVYCAGPTLWGGGQGQRGGGPAQLQHPPLRTQAHRTEEPTGLHSIY